MAVFDEKLLILSPEVLEVEGQVDCLPAEFLARSCKLTALIRDPFSPLDDTFFADAEETGKVGFELFEIFVFGVRCPCILGDCFFVDLVSSYGEEKRQETVFDEVDESGIAFFESVLQVLCDWRCTLTA